MAAFNKFNSFVEAVFEKQHNFGSDTFTWLLTNTAPTAANTQKSNLTEIATGNGYTQGALTQTISSSSQTGGTYSAVMSGDAVVTATGAVGPFRYVALYNETSTGDLLVGWYDYGSAVTLATGETFTIASNGVTLISAS